MIIGVWEVGDLFGETFFTKFGEKIRDSLHFVTRNVQHFVKKWGQNKVIFLVKIFFTKYGDNASDSLELVTKLSLNLVKNLGNHQIW